MLKKKGADGVTTHPIWCQICQTKHIDPKLDQERRQRIVLGSSTLAHLWKSNGFNSQSHIDFDCIIGEILKSSFTRYELLDICFLAEKELQIFYELFNGLFQRKTKQQKINKQGGNVFCYDNFCYGSSCHSMPTLLHGPHLTPSLLVQQQQKSGLIWKRAYMGALSDNIW